MADESSNFFKNLKNRKVYRVALVYTITAWIIVQVADATFPFLNLPDWMVTAVIVFVIIGFPIAIVLSWAYEMSPDGLVRTTSESAENNPLPPRKRKPFTSALSIIVLLALVAAQFVYIFFFRNSNKEILSEEIRDEWVSEHENFVYDWDLSNLDTINLSWIC